jgi:hypothetical protein
VLVGHVAPEALRVRAVKIASDTRAAHGSARHAPARTSLSSSERLYKRWYSSIDAHSAPCELMGSTATTGACALDDEDEEAAAMMDG